MFCRFFVFSENRNKAEESSQKKLPLLLSRYFFKKNRCAIPDIPVKRKCFRNLRVKNFVKDGCS